MRCRTVLVAAAAGGGLLLPAVGQAAESTWEGRCLVQAPVEASVPVGPVPAQVSVGVVLSGTCQGRLDGVAVRPVAVLRVPAARGTLGCAGGELVGDGELELADRDFPVRLTLRLTGPSGTAVATGRDGATGAAEGTVTLVGQDFGGPEQAQCAAGRMSRFPMRVELGGPGLRMALPGAPAGTPARLVAGTARRHGLTAALRRGWVRASCTAPRAGRCTLRVVADGTTIARGTGTVRAGQRRTMRLRLTPAGRRALRLAQGDLPARLRATGPGGAHEVALRFRD